MDGTNDAGDDPDRVRNATFAVVHPPADYDHVVIPLPEGQRPFDVDGVDACKLSREIQSFLFHYGLGKDCADVLVGEDLVEMRDIRLADPDGDAEAKDYYEQSVHKQLTRRKAQVLMKKAFRRMLSPNPYAAVGALPPIVVPTSADVAAAPPVVTSLAAGSTPKPPAGFIVNVDSDPVSSSSTSTAWSSLVGQGVPQGLTGTRSNLGLSVYVCLPVSVCLYLSGSNAGGKKAQMHKRKLDSYAHNF